MYTAITADPIEPGEILGLVGAPEDGAVLLFLGVVRNHNDGRSVSGMRYECYVEMAREELRAIAQEGAEILGTERLAVVHRVGALAIGEVSVAVAVSSPHRDEAYRASRHVMEEIKKRLPVWKEEFYTGGESRWVDGVVPGAPGEENG